MDKEKLGRAKDIEWWLSDNKALQTLVLQVYTEKELQRYINKMLHQCVLV